MDFNLEGIGTLNGGEFRTITVEGVGNCTNDLKAKSIEIEGVFSCSGKVETDYLSSEGTTNMKSDLRAKKIIVEGLLSVENGKVEANEIICDGLIKTHGEISADVIMADGCIEAKEIVGDHITIDSHQHGFLSMFNHYKSEIQLIEATTIELTGVTAETVNGKNIDIGPDCRIQNIDCSGTLSIDKRSSVRNITGNYTMRN